jgi:hypothetical protein
VFLWNCGHSERSEESRWHATGCVKTTEILRYAQNDILADFAGFLSVALAEFSRLRRKAVLPAASEGFILSLAHPGGVRSFGGFKESLRCLKRLKLENA